MLQSYNQLCDIVDKGYIRGVEREAINPASIDLRLGPGFLIEYHQPKIVDLGKRQSVEYLKWNSPDDEQASDYFDLRPGQFILAHTIEKFYMPDNLSAEFSLKSSLARNGLEHLLAGWIDPGFTDSVITLELKNNTNYHTLRLKVGMYIGQVKFFMHEAVPEEHSYKARGRYNGDNGVQSIKL